MSIPQEPVYETVSPLSSEADSDSDDPTVRHARNSTEIAQHDNEILEEEEERVKLLLDERSTDKPEHRGKDGSTGSTPKTENAGRNNQKTNRRRRKRHGGMSEEGELMYEMEEGGLKSETSSQASSSLELDKLNAGARHASKSRRKKQLICGIISVSVGIPLLILFIVTWVAYQEKRTLEASIKATLRSNGTSLFAPTTILISLDGFRADFLTRNITPTLNEFIANGVSPRYMHPSFPSLTFPNHFTLVTGLHPESHGVVGNTFWDPKFEEEFYYTHPAQSMKPKWWAGGEPIWVTAEKMRVKTAIHMWPGSEAGMEFSATYLDKYNGSEVLPRKTERILGLLDLPSMEDSATNTRPQLIAAYVPNVDSAGHKHGPNSTEILDTIANVDNMLHNLFIGLEERNLTDIVNVVIVSDHGMATTSTDRLIQLDDLIDLDLVEHIDGWPLYGLRPKDPNDLRGLYNRLNVEAMRNANFNVYLRDADMPERFHFSNNERIAPLWVIPKVGWAIVHKEDFNVKEAKAKGETYHPKGLHGYDHEHPLMRAIFVARGPAFPHAANSRLDVFQNTEVYNIVCDSLGIEPKPNNGTLRLPLKPVGLHSDETEDDDHPVDFEGDSDASKSDEHDDDGKKEEQSDNENDVGEDGVKHGSYKDFFAYMKAKWHKAVEWAHGVIAKIKISKEGDDDDEDGKG